MSEPVRAPYLLCLNIASYRDATGRRFLDPLWHKDLLAHTQYLPDLTVVAPCRRETPPSDALPWPPDLAGVRFVDLPDARNTLHALWLLPLWTARIWTAMTGARIVHTGIVGWPIPFGWLAAPMSRLRGRPSVIVVESAPWRTQSRIKARLFETLGRWCVRGVDLVLYTQQEYQSSLPPAAPGRGHLMQASWLDADIILPDSQAASLWHSKRNVPPVRLLFAGRLHSDKGVLVLLEAISRLSGYSVRLDIMGAGPLQEACVKAAADAPDSCVTMIEPIPYGPGFFAHLRSYHAVVVPSVSDEQPRIVYDAFSQALPVLASDTSGLRACVESGVTGLFAPPGDTSAWTDLLASCASRLPELESMGMAALAAARGVTHEQMHAQRAVLLQRLL